MTIGDAVTEFPVLIPPRPLVGAQLYVKAPDAFRTALFPLHNVTELPADTTGSASVLIVTEAVLVHPFKSLPVTVNVEPVSIGNADPLLMLPDQV